jgi:hypothetical protein
MQTELVKSEQPKQVVVSQSKPLHPDIAEAIAAVAAEQQTESTAEKVEVVNSGDKAEAPQETAPEGAESQGNAEDQEKGQEASQEVEALKSTAWAAVKRAEKKLREERTAMRAEKAEITKLRAEVEKLKSETVSFREAIKRDPLKVMDEAGLRFEDLVHRINSDGKASPEETMRDSERRALQEAREAKEEAKRVGDMFQKMQYSDLERQYRGSIADTLKGEQFDVIRGIEGVEQEIFNLADMEARRSGNILTPEQAANSILAEWQSHVKQLKSNKAIMALLLDGASAEAQPQKTSSVTSAKSAGPRTITNTTQGPPISEPERELTEREQIAEALKHLQR